MSVPATIKYTIVGGGIGGLAVALELLDRGVAVGNEITIFDSANQLGGRLLTTRDSRNIYELGAGRYNRSLHLLLDGLLKRFSIAISPFSYSVNYGVDIDCSQLSDLRSIKFDTYHGQNVSFIKVLRTAVGDKNADLFCSLSGYEAIRGDDFPLAGALDLIYTHPEVFTSYRFINEWFAPDEGFIKLIDQISDFLRSCGVTFVTHAKLVTIVEAMDKLLLNFEELVVNIKTCLTEFLFLAVPPYELKLIKHPWHHKVNWLDRLVNIPLFKCFLRFTVDWWLSTSHSVCVITGNNLQKLYFNPTQRNIFFYCDSLNANYWHALSTMNDFALEREVLRQIEEAMGIAVPTYEEIDKMIFKYWPTGVMYFSQSSTFLDSSFKFGEKIFFVSDTLTHQVGWIEGALISARSVVNTLIDDQ
jgi:monoamine oxidase